MTETKREEPSQTRLWSRPKPNCYGRRPQQQQSKTKAEEIPVVLWSRLIKLIYLDLHKKDNQDTLQYRWTDILGQM